MRLIIGLAAFALVTLSSASVPTSKRVPRGRDELTKLMEERDAMYKRFAESMGADPTVVYEDGKVRSAFLETPEAIENLGKLEKALGGGKGVSKRSLQGSLMGIRGY